MKYFRVGFILITLSLLVAVIVIDAYADGKNNIVINLDRSIGITGQHNSVFTDKDVSVTDYKLSKHFADIIGFATHRFETSGSEFIDNSVDVVKKIGDTTFIGSSVTVFTNDRYQDYINSLHKPQQGRDEGGAPSRSGVGTHDNDKFYFGNVIEQPVFVTSNTEIFILNMKATDRYVPVYYNGMKLPGYIDVGVHPKDQGVKWLSPGNKPFPIPFEVYYGITSEGHLLHFGAGYQHVYRDLTGNTIQNEKEDGLTHYEPLRPNHTYDEQMKLAYYLRS